MKSEEHLKSFVDYKSIFYKYIVASILSLAIGCGVPAPVTTPVVPPVTTTPAPIVNPPVTPPVNTSPSPVEIPSVGFTTSASTITEGMSASLTVTATNGVTVTITGSDGSSYALPSSGGSQTVSPTKTTTYTATVVGASTSVSAQVTVIVTVPPPPPPVPVGTTVSNVQEQSSDWQSFGQVGPKYIDCGPSPCEGIAWSMKYGITNPSLSNDATEFTLGGTTDWGDVLFTAELIGTNAPSLKDSSHTLLPTLHNFTYDVDFYVTNPAITQALEFDISVWMGNTAAMTFGTQCNYLGDKDWDVYDNSHRKWMSAGVPCKFVTGWNHLTLQFQRQPNNTTLYKSITLNGTTYTLNQSYPSVLNHSSWWGVNVNYQMDGDSKHDPNVTYLDNLSVTYQ